MNFFVGGGVSKLANGNVSASKMSAIFVTILFVNV
jgi:hypothetical protein